MLIAEVQNQSIGEEIGLEAGDRLLQINGQPIADILAYRFAIAEEELELEIEKTSGEIWQIEIEKDFGEDLGLEFTSNGLEKPISCRNNCRFCFVSQMPPGMRASLYVKDDDYRLSFLQGNFITLTNLGEAEMERIIAEHFSPLYVSVHTTDPDLRIKLMGNPAAGQILEQLKRLVENGITIHAQIVLCPELNDGTALEQTISDLAQLGEGLASLAVVPVGLTAFRKESDPLRTFTPLEAEKVLAQIQKWQQKFLAERQNPVVFASDEFYLLTGQAIPEEDFYADYPQIENGVGLVRQFWQDWEQAAWPQALAKPQKFRIITGRLGALAWQPLLPKLAQIANLSLELTVITNDFFGKQVTVAGLLTATDLLKAAAPYPDPQEIWLLPAVLLRDKDEDPVFLDDWTLEDFRRQLSKPVWVIEKAEDFISLLKNSDLSR